MEAAVLPGIELREAARDDDFLRADMLDRAVMQRQDQFFSDDIIASGQDHHELVSAGPEYRTVLENVADQPAGTDDVLVSRLVAEGIVDHLQAVYIADRNGKRICCLLLDGSVDLLLP